MQTTAAGFTYTLSPTLLMDGNVGYTRQNIGADGDPQDGNYGLDVLKIPGTNGVGPNYCGHPAFQVTGIANIGNTSTGSPFQFRDNQYTTAINVGKIKGAHSLRFGFEYDHYALNHFQPQGGTFGTARGTFGFDGTLTALKGGPTDQRGPSNSWAQFLLGFPPAWERSRSSRIPTRCAFPTGRFTRAISGRSRSKLTVNYGLRWEYYPIFSHDHYGAVRFDPATHNILIGGEGGVPWDTGASASKKGFRSAPRPGVSPGREDRDPHRLRNHRRSGQHAQPAQRFPVGGQPGLQPAEHLPVRHIRGRSPGIAAKRHSGAALPGHHGRARSRRRPRHR